MELPDKARPPSAVRSPPPFEETATVRVCLCLLVLLPGATIARADEYFEKHVRPLLVRHCVACHGPTKQKARLRLDTRAGWQAGGDSGSAIVPGDPARSLLIKAVRGSDGVTRMPPKGELVEQEVAVLTKWIKDGAVDPRNGGPTRLGGTTAEGARKWWSFRPVKRPPVPKNAATNPVDAFITERLARRGLALSAPTDRQTLLRRVTYDLTGLPPSSEEVEAFLKDDSAGAFTKVVDRLLASPHYGERWGRHWLDLVRYADTAGENSDHPLPHAWRYRNWVIDAFNRDKPYDEFLREQIAGDVLASRGPTEEYAARTVATGFLALARRFDHDSDKSMHLTHEDGIDTLGKAFLGLTLGCARCHDHKYDAVTTRDYYALYGILDSTKFSFPGCEAKQQPRDLVPLLHPVEWDRVVKPYREKLAALEDEIRVSNDKETRLARSVQAAFTKSRRVLSAGEIADGGDKRFGGPGKVDVRPGEMLLLSVTPLKNHGADTTLIEWEITEAGGSRRKWNATTDLAADILSGNPHADRFGNEMAWWLLDVRNQPRPLPEAIRGLSGKPGLDGWRNGDTPSVFANTSSAVVRAWTTLAPRSLFLHPARDGNVALGWLSPISGPVTVKGRVKDAHPGGPDGVGWVLEHFAVDVRRELVELAAESQRIRGLRRRRADLLRSAPKQEVVFAVMEGKPGDARVQLRGDPEKLGDVVPRRWLEVLGGQPISKGGGSGRLDLAGWVASNDNPLTARVMVNRVWLHHFGKGLVKTPNDFGTRGEAPTHPELLDWLASEFVASGWRVKTLHRTILLSATYQQASGLRSNAVTADAGNDLYWRFDRRRLSAEEIRDSILEASGQLDRTPAAAHPFPPESTWGYTQHAPFATFFETDRRSVYLVSVRNRRHPFLGLFDGADPNASTPARQTTTVPTQALYFLNDPFFHAQADRVAARVLAGPEAERLDALFRTTLRRPPTDADRHFAGAFLPKYFTGLSDVPPSGRPRAAWAALARVLLASNEFLFVE